MIVFRKEKCRSFLLAETKVLAMMLNNTAKET
jgi:hypothetical protein